MTIMGIAAEAREIDLTGMRAEVIKVMDGPPRHISAVRVAIYLPAKDYTPEQRKLLTKAAEACPVGRSLNERLVQEVELVW